MADEVKKEVAALAGNIIVLLNRGQRIYQTSAGALKPGESLALPAAEAAKFLGYSDLMDASKVVKDSADAGLKAENAALRDQVDRLTSANTEITVAHADLTAKAEQLQKDVDALLQKEAQPTK